MSAVTSSVFLDFLTIIFACYDSAGSCTHLFVGAYFVQKSSTRGL